jgi:hypothetical protein
MQIYKPRDRYFVQYNGQEINLHLACQQAEVPYHAAIKRVHRGMTPQEAFDCLLPADDEEMNGDE